MGKTKNFILIMGIFALAALIIGAKARTWAAGGNNRVIDMDINELVSSPRTYLKGEVEFVCRFATLGKLFRENTASFGAETHINFAAWRPMARLWKRDERLNLLPSLYISKERKDLCDILLQMPRYRNIIIRGKVKSTYANLPWIEVTAIRDLGSDNVNDDLLRKASRVSALLTEKKLADAKRIFTLINNKSTPKFILSELAEEITQATPVERSNDRHKTLVASARKFAAAGEFKSAISMLLEAKKFSPKLAEKVWFNQELASYYMQSKMTSKLELAKECLVIANSIAKGKDARIYNMLADIELKRNNQDDAEEFINLALQIDKDNSRAQKTLAQITSDKLSAQSEPVTEKAEGTILQITPDYLNIGKEFLNKGDFANAQKQLRLALDAGEKEAVALLASALLAQGKVEQAQKVLAETVEPTHATKKKAVKSAPKEIIPVAPKAVEMPMTVRKQHSIPQSVETDFNDVFATMNEMKNDLESSSTASFDESDTLALKGQADLPQKNQKNQTVQPQRNEVKIKHEIHLPKLPDIDAAPRNMSKLPDWAR